MELLLIRHAQAQPIGSSGIERDRDRDLTPDGVAVTERIADALNKFDVRIAAMLVSPFRRTMHTAGILCDRLHHPPQLRVSENLTPRSTIAAAVNEIRQNAELECIAMCGHEPTLSGLADRLLGSRYRPSLIFHTGAAAFLHVDINGKAPAATLHWFLDFRQLDLISRAP